MTWTDLVTIGCVVSFSGILFGFVGISKDIKEKYPIIIVLIGSSIVILGLVLANDESKKVTDEFKDIINSWPCDNLHDNILNQIKNNNSTLLDYQKDLYHFKCEAMP